MHAEATNARNRGKRRGKWKSWREARREENERNICGGNDGDDDMRLTSMRVNRKAKRLFFERINTRT